MKAYIMVITKPGTAEEVAKVIRKIESVTSAECLYGRFDVIVIADSPEMDVIDCVIHEVQRNPNALRTETALTHCSKELQGISE